MIGVFVCEVCLDVSDFFWLYMCVNLFLGGFVKGIEKVGVGGGGSWRYS